MAAIDYNAPKIPQTLMYKKDSCAFQFEIRVGAMDAKMPYFPQTFMYKDFPLYFSGRY